MSKATAFATFDHSNGADSAPLPAPPDSGVYAKAWERAVMANANEDVPDAHHLADLRCQLATQLAALEEVLAEEMQHKPHLWGRMRALSNHYRHLLRQLDATGTDPSGPGWRALLRSLWRLSVAEADLLQDCHLSDLGESG